jgi:diguanylate cyclase (GGDEF)-like protein
MKILLIDDDEQVAKLVTTTLTAQRYTVDVAVDGMDGWDLVTSSPYDLVLLDVMMPRLDGISFCRRLRAQKKNTPVILLTARDTSNDKMNGLDAGADDYLVKPLDLQELSARIRALLRRGITEHSPVLAWGDLQLNPATLEVKYQEQPLHFRRKEFAILELLLRNRQRVFSRSAILDQLWSFDEAPGEETVKAHIKAIRQQLRTVDAEDLIETLYGQGYRLNPAYLSVKPTKASSTTVHAENAEATRSTIAKIWQQTKSVSFDRLVVIEQAVTALETSQLGDDLRQQAEQNAHKMLGSLGTFGLVAGSQIARQLEGAFASTTALEQIPIQKIRQLVAALRQQLEADVVLPEPNLDPHSQSEPSLNDQPPGLDTSTMPLLLVVDDDRHLTEQLATAATSWKFRTTIAPDLATAREQVRQNRPDVILLDLSFETGENGLLLLEEMAAYRSQIPVLVLTERDRFVDRVAVARLGGHLFLQKPTNTSDVMQAVTHVWQQSHKPEAKILAVDDDPQIILVLKALLEPWGLEVVSLSDSTQFWDVLKTSQPDLVMLDVQMPDINGIELCQAIRSDPQWSWLPILFLTSHTDTSTMYRVFEVGGDDYITKPIVAAELVNRILNRLERTRLLRSQTEIDPITGVANRQRGTQDLEKLLEMAKHTNQPVCLAVLEVDQLKQINTRYGYAAGEKALRQVGQLLKQKLRQEDLVVRWGGAEFVVGIYGMTQTDGVEWLAEILETLRSLAVVTANEETFQISFSAGVVQYPVDGVDLEMLYRTADTVLYRAKEAGGNRVLPFGWQPPDPAQDSTQVVLIHPDTTFANQIFQALETRGYHAQWFKSSPEAASKLAGTHPELRSTAIVLGGFSESETHHALKQLGTKTLKQNCVLLLLPDSRQAETALRMGIKDYILTPCQISIVMQSLRNALGS